MNLAQQIVRVNCRHCNYSFPVDVPIIEDWCLKAQCPSCEGWDHFTIAHTQVKPKPDPRQWDEAIQQLGKKLWRPINEHRSHPVIEWFEKVGHGLFKDDYTPLPYYTRLPLHYPRHGVYRFRFKDEVAYLWQEGCHWLVISWRLLRGSENAKEPIEVNSFKEGLDQLKRLPL